MYLGLYFNPIIGLILISESATLYAQLMKFQSHYRSDFNSISTLLASISSFQSHYRSDFNMIPPLKAIRRVLISIPL